MGKRICFVLAGIRAGGPVRTGVVRFFLLAMEQVHAKGCGMSLWLGCLIALAATMGLLLLCCMAMAAWADRRMGRAGRAVSECPRQAAELI